MANDKESFTIADGVRRVSLARLKGEVLTEGLKHILKFKKKYRHEGECLLRHQADFNA